VSEGESFVNKLEEMVDQLKRLSVEQKTVGPKRDEAIENLLTEAQTLSHDFADWRGQQEQNERLARVIDAIGKSLETAMERLSVSEARLDHVERAVDGTDGEPDLDPEILAEAEFLAEELAGLPTPASQPRFLKDGLRPEPASGLAVLRAALSTKSP
jgi:DNA repair exonuclease SbcCD ATPase subunit